VFYFVRYLWCWGCLCIWSRVVVHLWRWFWNDRWRFFSKLFSTRLEDWNVYLYVVVVVVVVVVAVVVVVGVVCVCVKVHKEHSNNIFIKNFHFLWLFVDKLRLVLNMVKKYLWQMCEIVERIPLVNFTNISWAAFLQILFKKIIQTQTVSTIKKLHKNTLTQKRYS